MRLTKVGNYADFVFYPLLVLAMVTGTIATTTPRQWIGCALALVIGVAGWTLLEYILHRIILHCAWPFRQMHALHHASPAAMIGTPTWLTAPIIGTAIFLPLWRVLDFDLASGLSVGLTLGYLWFVIVHHAIHHWRARPGSFLLRAKRRHLQHHCASPKTGNFGVTTAFWDRVFRTSGTSRHRVTDDY